jgi:D-alanyl-D-alanine carboxypeptidase
MNCFASSIHVDLDGGVAAFASINAMQGYRPTPVTQYAVQLMRAEREAKPLPAAEPLANPIEVENAGEYAGVFQSADGRQLLFKAEGKRLVLIDRGSEVALQRREGDSFLSTEQGRCSDYSLVFARDQSSGKADKTSVVEVGYGPNWFVNTGYRGDREFHGLSEYSAFVGRYRSDGGDDVRVFKRKGQLWLGDTRLTGIGSGLFRMGDDSWSPDTAQFLSIVDGRARLLRVIDEDYWRVEVGP